MTPINPRFVLIVLALVILVVPAQSSAQWGSGGPVLDESAGPQNNPTSFSNGNGGVYVAWGGNPNHVQHVDKWGLLCWPRPTETLPGYNGGPKMVASDAGGAIIANSWNGGYVGLIRIQKLSSKGRKLWNEPNYVCLIDDSDVNFFGEMVADGSDGAIVTWIDNRLPGGNHGYAQRLDSDGVIQWDTSGVAITTDPVASDGGPRIVSDDSGGAIYCWGTNISGKLRTFVQRIDANGMTQWGADGVELYSEQEDYTVFSSGPKILSDGAGGAIIFWYDFRDYVPGDERTHIYAQRVDHSGAPQWTPNGELVLPDIFIWPNSNDTDVTLDGAGGAVVVCDKRQLVAQKIDSGGNVQWTANGVPVCSASSGPNMPKVTADMSGGAIVAWEDHRTPGELDIFVQKISSVGSVMWDPEGTPFDTSHTYVGKMNINSDGEGGAIITWYADDGAHAMKIDASGDSPPVGTSTEVVFQCNLNQNVPNPFNPTTHISFTLPTATRATVKVYDVAGRHIVTLYDDVAISGVTGVKWTGIDKSGAPVPSGVYFYRLTAGNETLTRKMVLLK